MSIERIDWKISIDNPRLPFLKPLAFECLTCREIFFEVGIDEEDLIEKKKISHYAKNIESFRIQPTELLGPTPCGHVLGERHKERLGPFDIKKLKKMKQLGRLP